MVRGGLLFAFAGLMIGCKQPAALPHCPAKYTELPAALKAEGGECACPMGVGSGQVWGTGVYTQDSALCRAAVHAGAIDAARGGAVKFRPAPGCPRYKGTDRREVTTSNWNAYPASFYFQGFGEAACPTGIPNECPASFNAIPGAAELTTFTCSCDQAEGVVHGKVWGTGVYTRDSSICAAAVHAGAVGVSGGKVTLRPSPGCMQYSGSTQHKVTSSEWGRYDQGSFYFEDFGPGACQLIPADLCPGNFLAIPGSAQLTRFSCTCDGEPKGNVWGSGIYTRDSSLCAAAVHAGGLPDRKGKITVRPAPPCQRYEGSVRNGITTAGWGAYAQGSFTVEGTAEGSCPP